MDRRSFLKVIGITPAIPAVASIRDTNEVEFIETGEVGVLKIINTLNNKVFIKVITARLIWNYQENKRDILESKYKSFIASANAVSDPSIIIPVQSKNMYVKILFDGRSYTIYPELDENDEFKPFFII